MRYKEPKFVTEWKDAIKQEPPRCCHTCENYLGDGSCQIFNMVAPEDFAEAVGVCSDWERAIPF